MNANQLISEVGLRCGDPEYKDFEKSVYERAIYRCNREVAKYYGVFQKILRFTLRDMTGEVSGEVILEIPDFKAEYLVDVNGFELIKVANKIENNHRGTYYMELKDGRLHFNYTMGLNENFLGYSITGRDITTVMSNDIFERIEVQGQETLVNKSMDDVVTICYYIIPDLESDIGEYDIPSRFEEEQIEKAVCYMSKLGMINFPGENEKALKYQNLYKLYRDGKRSDYDKMMAKDSEWVKIQPWSPV